MMAIHHIIFPLTYGNGLYTISPPFGLYSMAVLQVRGACALGFACLFCVDRQCNPGGLAL